MKNNVIIIDEEPYEQIVKKEEEITEDIDKTKITIPKGLENT